MNFEDIKDQLTSQAKQLWERIQDSSAFNQLRDRYENMNPRMQKLTILGGAAFVALVVFSFPFGYWQQSTESVQGFEDRRDLVRRLLKVSREAADAPDIPMAPMPDSLRGEVENYLRSIQLLPEQIRAVQTTPADSSLIPTGMAQGGVSVNLAKLNLRQIVDIGHRLKSLNPSVKMTSMQMIPNREDARYFDVVFKLISLAVPQAAPPPPPEIEEPAAGKRPSFRSKKNNAGDE